jgi:hypothetical protein
MICNYLFYINFLLLDCFLYLGLMACWKIHYYLFIHIFISFINSFYLLIFFYDIFVLDSLSYFFFFNY